MNDFLYITPLIFFIALNGSFSLLFRQKFGRMLPGTFILSVLVMYISGFVFSTFLYGFLLLMFGAIIFPLVLFVKCKDDKHELNYFFTYGLFSFIIIYFILLFVDYGRHLGAFDELMYWGKMVKEMWRLDAFYSIPESTMFIHKSYPPFMSLFELLWCYIASYFSESLISLSLHVFMIGILVVPFNERVMDDSRISLKQIVFSVISIMCFLHLIVFFDAPMEIYTTFNTIYVDIVLGILFAYNLLCAREIVASGFNANSIFFFLSSAALVLTKDTGLCLFMVSVFYLLISLLRLVNLKSINKKKTIILSLLIVGVFCISAHWKVFTTVQMANDTNLSLLDMFEESIESSNISKTMQIATNYFYEIMSFSIVNHGYIRINFTHFLIALICLYVLCYKNIQIIDRYLFFLMTFGAFGYILLYLLVYAIYMSHADPAEAMSFNSLPRYFTTYVISYVLVIVCIAGVYARRKVILYFQYFYLFSIIVLANGTNSALVNQNWLIGHVTNDYEQIAYNINNKDFCNNKILLICDSPSCLPYINYYVDCNYMNTNRHRYTSLDEALSDNDYIYIVHPNSELNAKYSKYNNGEEFLVGSMYEVVFNESTMSLQLLLDS